MVEADSKGGCYCFFTWDGWARTLQDDELQCGGDYGQSQQSRVPYGGLSIPALLEGAGPFLGRRLYQSSEMRAATDTLKPCGRTSHCLQASSS